MSCKKHTYARLGVLLASAAPVGVVFRRVRTKLVQIVLWHRDTDQFDEGQFFKGRIYVDRSDISPDGRHLIYLAMGGLAWAIPETGGVWTALSRVPSLTATGLWGQGDTWGGGGMFTSNHSFWLDSNAETFTIREESGLRREFSRPLKSATERDGWKSTGTVYKPVQEKILRDGWILRKFGHTRGYELARLGGCSLVCDTWNWADWDRDRLVWAEDGCLRAATLERHKLGAAVTLRDFNDRSAEC